MTIVVVGPGAIGILVAGCLAKTNQPIYLLARPALAATLQQQGVWLGAPNGLARCDRVRVISDPAAITETSARWAVVCVKGYDTPGSFAILDALQPEQILTLQNGLGNEEQLVAQYGAARVVSGCITTSVEMEAPGRAVVAKQGGVGIAPMPGGPHAEPWIELFQQADFATAGYPNYQAMKWSKVMLNMLGNASAAILDLPVMTIYRHPELRALERQMLHETLMLMQRLGLAPVNLPRYPAAWLASAAKRLPTALFDLILIRGVAGGRGRKPPSLQLDLQRGNPRTEGEQLYGAVALAAARLQVATPVISGLWRVLQAIVTGKEVWDDYRGQPERLIAALRFDKA